MRTMMDYYSKLLNEKDYSNLNNKQKVPEILTESSMSRIISLTKKYDCAIITAFRDKLAYCLYDTENLEEISIYDNI